MHGGKFTVSAVFVSKNSVYLHRFLVISRTPDVKYKCLNVNFKTSFGSYKTSVGTFKSLNGINKWRVGINKTHFGNYRTSFGVNKTPYGINKTNVGDYRTPLGEFRTPVGDSKTSWISVNYRNGIFCSFLRKGHFSLAKVAKHLCKTHKSPRKSNFCIIACQLSTLSGSFPNCFLLSLSK